MEKEKLPNLRTAYENRQEDIEIYNYYKKIVEEEKEYKILREEYYAFLINLLKDINSSLRMTYRGGDTGEVINISRTLSTNYLGVINYIEKFLTSNNIGKIFSITQNPKDTSKYDYIVVIKCNFEDFFKAIYGEIQFMEYYEEDKTLKNR